MINTLNINQKELETAYDGLGDEISRLHDINKQFVYSSATMLQELDQKQGIHYLHATIQTTLLKIANSLSFALNKQASPYVLSTKELTDLAIEFRARNIFLSDQMNDVKTSVYNDNGQLLFTFEIPVLEEKNLFTLYKVLPIPTFLKDKVIQAKIPNNYIAYASANNEFTLLTAAEHQTCKKAEYCRVVDILRPVANTQNCVIKALETNSQTCMFEEIQMTEPFYKLYGNILIYSVKGQTQTRIICKTEKDFKQDIFYMNGIGATKIGQDCKIEFANHYKAYSVPEPKLQDLGPVRMLDVFKYTPDPHNYSIFVGKYESANYSVPKLNMTRVHSLEFMELMNEIINPHDAIPEILRVLIGLSIAAIILFLIIKCSSRNKTCFKT